MSAPSAYLMGHSERERRRLALQAKILNPMTLEFLRRAGLKPGMRILDLGCGVGDVAYLAAELVGPSGHVTALDKDVETLAAARAFAAGAQLAQVSFEQTDISNYVPRELFDAVIGRHILIHMPNAFEVLQRAASYVKPGGIVAFQEYDLSRCCPATPFKPLFAKVFQHIVDLFSRVTQADIGMSLFQMFHRAGMIDVQSRAEFALDGGAESPFYEWIAETVRSLSPMLIATKIATAEELDADTLSERLKREAISIGGCLSSPFLVGTSGRNP